MDIWLSFRDIEYVSAVAKYESISLAAAELHISQPALSIYLSKLESRLETPLFNRIGKKMVLTYAGECITKEGASILHTRDQIQNQLAEIIQYKYGRLRVGFPYVRGISMFPPVLKIFREKYPQVKVLVDENDAKILEQKLLDGELDVAFFNRVLDDPMLETHTIISDPVVLYTSQGSPLIASAVHRDGYPHPWIDLEQCRDEQYILNFPDQNTYQITKQIFKDYGLHPQITVQVKNQFTAIHLAAVGVGLYLAPEYFYYNINFSEPPALLSVGQEQSYSMDFIAAWRKGITTTELINEFVSIAAGTYRYAKITV